MIRAFLQVIAALIAAALAIWLVAMSALAHDFYSSLKNARGESCCSGRDCAPIPDEYVRETRGGYVVRFNDTDMLVPFDRVLPSPDRRFHACVWGGEIRCLIAPRGMS